MAGVAGGQNSPYRPAVANDLLPVRHGDVWNESSVGAGIERIGLADMQQSCRPVKALREHDGSGVLLQPGRQRGMVAMCVA